VAAIHFTAPTLLVGLSGAGKSQLLHYLHETCKLLLTNEPVSLPNGEYQLDFEHFGISYQFAAFVEEKRLVKKKLTANGEPVPLQSLKNKELGSHVLLAKNIAEIRHDSLRQLIVQADAEQLAEVKNLYCFIFQDISDIRFEEMRFKEWESDWIGSDKLSDGMLKTFSYLTELITAPSGSILLIDEFENGLGLNCLSALLEEMLARDDVQLILSSHHPYVINNVPTNCWRIISRKKGTVIARTAAEFGIGQTRYDAFFELMNNLYNEEENLDESLYTR